MTTPGPILPRRVPCEGCPLGGLKGFRAFTPEELSFVSRFKIGEMKAPPRATILQEGASSDHLFTLLSGWAFRYKTLPDGRRQILNFVLPGDLIGLQASLFTEMDHSVEALTDALLCVFRRDKLWDLYKNHPGLSYDLTWLVTREEQYLDGHLLSLGRRTAIERTAHLILHLFSRAREVGLAEGDGFSPPITQSHVADTLGMSLVHTNKTLRKLNDRRLIRWRGRMLTILDLEALKTIAHWSEPPVRLRPWI